jgi:hypothetical protein
MGAVKAGKKVRGRHKRHTAESLSGFSIAPLALPEEELRRLVLRLTTRGGVAPFVRRMVRLIDDLEAGRARPALRLARLGKDPSLRRLMLAMTREAQGGSFAVARNTALCAAGYAYQNSVDYICDLLSYLRRFRQKHSRPQLYASPASSSRRTRLT